LTITSLNDFIFCPRSIYFHNLYGKYKASVYKKIPQIVGSINHENIDYQKYSSAKRYIQGLEIYSEKYRLCGKLDVYDLVEKTLIERKTRVKKIYDGYKYQLYAQYFCLLEMGYKVEKLKIHSLENNKNYWIKIPKNEELAKFEALISQVRNFDLHEISNFSQNPEKCKNCIYAGLCDFSSA